MILADADTLAEPEPLHAAIHGAYEDGLLHLPYVSFRGLSENGTRLFLGGNPPEACETELAHDWATGGYWVIRPDAWWRAGGMDERFVAFGYEDTCYRIAADALLGPTVKHPGAIWHLYHEKTMGLGSPNHIANGELAARYVAAEGNADLVRAIVGEFARV
ncbi:hypothetical protein [Acrocarpospora sp. B8E8]|uniref:hypothetical protein n=1 Tax=Acrocarpospora sp. B8E8 TaxID=3153572 RepID=UPI00325F7739